MTKRARDAGAIRRELLDHEAAIAALESELVALEAVPELRHDLATPEQVAAYHRRRVLIEELTMMPPSVSAGVPLMVAQAEAAADLVIDDGMDVNAAVRRVLEGEQTNERSLRPRNTQIGTAAI
jgi:hypothetical protein